VTMADLRGPGKHSLHPLPVKPDTWQEVSLQGCPCGVGC
jgi:hypothetical protein